MVYNVGPQLRSFWSGIPLEREREAGLGCRKETVDGQVTKGHVMIVIYLASLAMRVRTKELPEAAAALARHGLIVQVMLLVLVATTLDAHMSSSSSDAARSSSTQDATRPRQPRRHRHRLWPRLLLMTPASTTSQPSRRTRRSADASVFTALA